MVAVGDESAAGVDLPPKPAIPAPPAAPTPPTSLTYERGAAVSVRGFRLLLALTLVNTVLLGSMVLGPQLFPWARQQLQAFKDARAERARRQVELAAQNSCRAHADPAGKVVYEEDPAEAAKLLSASPRTYRPALGRYSGLPGWVEPVHAVAPDYYADYLAAVYGSPTSDQFMTLLFLHERTAPGGDRCIVAVNLRAASGFAKDSGYPGTPSPAPVPFRQTKERTLVGQWFPVGASGPAADARGHVRALQLRLSLPDTHSRVVARLKPDAPLDQSPPIDYGNVVRFYAGQPDPADASHFTIAYQVDGKPGTIDGWLRDGGLELRPREGALSYDSDLGPVWKIPATLPTTPPE
jgi:hypothetical protein